MKNLTGRKGFDVVEDDPRVVEVRDEGADGYWLDLAAPWDFEGQIGIHGETVRHTLAQLGRAKKLTADEYKRIHG